MPCVRIGILRERTEMSKNARVLLLEFESAKVENIQHCCERMKQEVEFVCPTCEDALQCPDKLLYNSSIFDEYGILIHDGSGTYEIIEYCSWCGKKLPGSKRDEWFDALEKMGYDDPLNQEISEEFKGTEWYK